MELTPEYEPARVIVDGTRIAQSVSFVCGELVEVVFRTWMGKLTGEEDALSIVALAYETAEVANF